MNTNKTVDLRKTVNLPSAIRKMVAETPIVEFGIVKQVIAKGVVLVQLSVARDEKAVTLITCPLLSVACGNVTIDIEPKENDKVLVLFPRVFDTDMFDLDNKDTLINPNASGYNLLSGVAVLLTQYKKDKHKNILSISADDKGNITLKDNHDNQIMFKDTGIEITDKNDCTIISSSESIKINNKLEIRK